MSKKPDSNNTQKSHLELVRKYFDLINFEDSKCFQQANDFAKIIFSASENKKFTDLDELYTHSFTCNKKDCISICKLFNAIAIHILGTSSSHKCALKFIYSKYATLHFDTCRRRKCGIHNCIQFRIKRYERKIRKKFTEILLSDI